MPFGTRSRESGQPIAWLKSLTKGRGGGGGNGHLRGSLPQRGPSSLNETDNDDAPANCARPPKGGGGGGFVPGILCGTTVPQSSIDTAARLPWLLAEASAKRAACAVDATETAARFMVFSKG